jgi:hypothetical protein
VGGDVVVTSNQLSSYQLKTASGSALTSLNASALSTGIVPASVLPTNVTQLGNTIDLATSEVSGNLPWSRVEASSRPTTLAGYGITDSLSVATPAETVTGTNNNKAVTPFLLKEGGYLKVVTNSNGRISSAILIEPQGDIPMISTP